MWSKWNVVSMELCWPEKLCHILHLRLEILRHWIRRLSEIIFSTTNKVGKLVLNWKYNEGNPSLFTVYYKYNEYTNIKKLTSETKRSDKHKYN